MKVERVGGGGRQAQVKAGLTQLGGRPFDA